MTSAGGALLAEHEAQWSSFALSVARTVGGEAGR
jgi:hypothetical protein